MKRFQTQKVIQALEYAAAGGQALHTCTVPPNDGPSCFRPGSRMAHLIDDDTERLKKTARRVGVRSVKDHRDGRHGQHVDLCGRPLVMALIEAEEKN